MMKVSETSESIIRFLFSIFMESFFFKGKHINNPVCIFRVSQI